MIANGLVSPLWGLLVHYGGRWGPQGEVAGGEGALDVDEALVVAAAEAQGDVALGLDEGAVDEDVEFADDVEQFGVFLYFLPGEAGETPHVVAQLSLDAVDEGACAFGLQQGIAAAQGDRSLVIGNDLHQFVKGALFPTLEVPGVGVMAARATVVAARQID